MIRLRSARAEDAQRLHEWVNSPDSLAGKHATDRPIPWEHHRQWLEERLIDSASAVWIVECEGEAVGQLRVQDKDLGLEVDIYVIPSSRRAGVARRALELGAEAARERWPGRPLVALVLPDNTASRALFLAAGYGLMYETRGYHVFHLQADESRE